eukprot:214458-Chlamydomonas_euryale.AAC.1
MHVLAFACRIPCVELPAAAASALLSVCMEPTRPLCAHSLLSLLQAVSVPLQRRLADLQSLLADLKGLKQEQVGHCAMLRQEDMPVWVVWQDDLEKPSYRWGCEFCVYGWTLAS